MPIMNGIDLTKRIRNNSSSAKILLITGFFDDKYLNGDEFKTACISKVLHKPVKIKELLKYVHELCYSNVTTQWYKQFPISLAKLTHISILQLLVLNHSNKQTNINNAKDSAFSSTTSSRKVNWKRIVALHPLVRYRNFDCEREGNWSGIVTIN